MAREIAGHKNTNVEVLSLRNKLDSTVWNGQTSQMVQGELHERRPNFTDNRTSVRGTLCGTEFARPAECLGSHLSATTSGQAYLDNGVEDTQFTRSTTNEQKVIMGGLFIWEEIQAAKGMGKADWKEQAWNNGPEGE